MPKLSELKLTSERKIVLQFVTKDGADVAEVVHVNGKGPPKGALTVHYRPWYSDAVYYARLQEISDSGRWYDTWIENIVRHVTRWDLQDDDGAEIPLTHDALRAVPTRVLVLIDQALNEAVAPPSKSDAQPVS